MRIVINNDWGGFGLSDKAINMYRELSGYDGDMYDLMYDHKWRTNEHLIKVVEAFGAAAGDEYSRLAIVEIPDDVEWTIDEYDGREWVAEKHRTWQ